MTDTKNVPWHLWLVGVVSLLWNSFGAYDFINSVTRGEAYLRESGYTQAAIDYYNAMPNWMYVPWVVGVWGAVLGSILLLLRKRLTVPVWGLSLLGALVSLLYGMFINKAPPPPPEMAWMAWFPNIIVLIAAVFFLYARWMSRKGVLR
tara:strand:+ start:38 stop:481 length:444 start_codon:yes stop_codon:yes gene_type:complete